MSEQNTHSDSRKGAEHSANEGVQAEQEAPRTYGVTITLEPQNETMVMHKARSVHAVLKRLGIRPTTVLVIRDGGLLTPDRHLYHGDEIIVRTVVSSG